MKKEEKKNLKKFYIAIAVIVILIVLIDQLSKILLIHYGEKSLASGTILLKEANLQSGAYDETSRGVTILTNLVIIAIIFGIIKSDNQFITKKTKIGKVLYSKYNFCMPNFYCISHIQCSKIHSFYIYLDFLHDLCINLTNYRLSLCLF